MHILKKQPETKIDKLKKELHILLKKQNKHPFLYESNIKQLLKQIKEEIQKEEMKKTKYVFTEQYLKETPDDYLEANGNITFFADEYYHLYTFKDLEDWFVIDFEYQIALNKKTNEEIMVRNIHEDLMYLYELIDDYFTMNNMVAIGRIYMDVISFWKDWGDYEFSFEDAVNVTLANEKEYNLKIMEFESVQIPVKKIHGLSFSFDNISPKYKFYFNNIIAYDEDVVEIIDEYKSSGSNNFVEFYLLNNYSHPVDETELYHQGKPFNRQRAMDIKKRISELKSKLHFAPPSEKTSIRKQIYDLETELFNDSKYSVNKIKRPYVDLGNPKDPKRIKYKYYMENAGNGV